jgi:hypothetical protein
LYEAGRVYSAVRQAKQVASQRQIQIIESARAVRESTTSSWNFVVESQSQIAASKAEVSAAALALDGVSRKPCGSRTTPMFDAEQEVTNAQLGLWMPSVSHRRCTTTAAGKSDSAQSGLGRYYDPVNYRKCGWFGTDADTIETARIFHLNRAALARARNA